MAKCIRIRGTNWIARVSNEEAERHVASGNAEYTSKGAWKDFRALIDDETT